MLSAASVAVVGASPRPHSLGRRVMAELTGHGYPGRVIPVTPAHEEVAGIAAVPSLDALDEPIDLAILAVADSRLEEQVEKAITAGSRSLTIFSPGVGTAVDGKPLRDRLAGLVREAGIPLCGPNGMGFVNVEVGLRATGFYQPPVLEPGGVAFLSHSGSLFSAMLHNHRDLRFNLVVSTGQELGTTMDEYLDHVVGLDSTRVVGLFMETIRRPEAMAAALARAGDRDIPVVALKVGRTARAREAAATHSGALAGEDGAYDAFFRHWGVHRVDTMDEMVDTLEVFAQGLRARPGGLGAVHDSGGERSLLIDTAANAGVPLAEVGPATRERLAAVLEPGLEPDNPVDAWGTGHGHEDIFEASLRALADDPAVGVVAFCVDLTPEEDPADGYQPLLTRLHPDLAAPLIVISNLATAIDRHQATALRGAGIPVVEGTRSGLAAIRALFDHSSRPERPAPIPVAGPGEDRIAGWRTRLATGDDFDESESLRLLADYGFEVVATRSAGTAEQALRAAAELGWPVVMKTAGVPHKTDVDGVRLNLGPAEFEAAYRDLAARLGPQVVIQPQVPPGRELALGIVLDYQFGPLVMVAAGGVDIEVNADRAFALPPLDPRTAMDLVASLRIRPLLDGVRGALPADVPALAEALVALSMLAVDLGDSIGGVDVNPLVVGPKGAVAVDALVTARSS